MSNLIDQLKSIQAQLSQAIDSCEKQHEYSFEFWSELQQAQDHLSVAIATEAGLSEEEVLADNEEVYQIVVSPDECIKTNDPVMAQIIEQVVRKAVRTMLTEKTTWGSHKYDRVAIYTTGREKTPVDFHHACWFDDNKATEEACLHNPNCRNYTVLAYMDLEQAKALNAMQELAYERYLNDV